MPNHDTLEPEIAPPAPEGPGQPRRRARWWAAAGIGAALLLAAGLAVGLGQTAGPTSPSAVQTPTPSASPAGDATTPASPAPTPATPDASAAPAPAPAVQDPAIPPAPTLSPEDEARLATVDQPTSPAVPLTDQATVADGITAKITLLQAVQGEAQGIGEIAGPALRFTITVANGSGQPISLANAVVNVAYGPENIPSSPLSGPDVTPFPATVEAGGSASGTFVFAVPVDSRDDVEISLNYSVSAPIAVFAGQAPRA